MLCMLLKMIHKNTTRTFVNYLNSLVFKCQLYCKVVNRRFRNRLTINTRRNGEYRRVHVQEVDEDDIVPGLTSLIFTSGSALQWGLEYPTFKFRTHSKLKHFDVWIWDILVLQ